MILFDVETPHIIRLRDQLQKRLSGPVVVAKSTEHHRGDGTRVLFLHAAPWAFRGIVRRAIVNPTARCSGVCQLLLDFGESECDFSGLHDDPELLAQLRQR